MQLYEHSGAVTIGGLILASLVEVVTGCVLRSVYTFSNFLTIQSITQTTDKNGDLSTEEESLVSNLVIGEADMKSVRNAGRDRPPEEDGEADQPA